MLERSSEYLDSSDACLKDVAAGDAAGLLLEGYTLGVLDALDACMHALHSSQWGYL